MPASTNSFRWCETVGWLRPTGSGQVAHARLLVRVGRDQGDQPSRAGSASALNPAASVAASSGLITCRTTGVQQSVSNGSVGRSDGLSWTIGMRPG